MYKSTGDKLAFISRVSSHATKPSRRGIIQDIPEWAKEPEEYYNTIFDQYLTVLNQKIDCESQLAEIKQKLKTTLPAKEYEHWAKIRESIAQRTRELEESASHFRSITRAAGDRAWFAVFFYCAKKILDTEVLKRIQAETLDVIGRDGVEVSAGRADMTEQQRARIQNKEKLQQRRQRFRARMSSERRTVWRDGQ